MLNLPQESPIRAEFERQGRQRTIRRLANAVAQASHLRMDDAPGALAHLLDQPITLRDSEALQRWVADMLIELDLRADNAAIEPLCLRLTKILGDVS